MISGTQTSEQSSSVFISHSTHDRDVAENLCNYLETCEIGCWMAPRDIHAGANWASSIIDAIRQCDVMLLVYSEHSNASLQVLREIERALKHKLTIITYRLDQSSPSGDFEYFLSTVQWLDAQGDQEAEFYQLAKSIKPLLGQDFGDNTLPTAQDTKQASIPPRRKDKASGANQRLKVWWKLAALALVTALIGGLITFWSSPSEKAPMTATAQAEQKKIAVLPFRNLSGTVELDWLRNGLSEMFITDLSQQGVLQLLTSQQIYQLLAEDGVVPTSPGSLAALQDIGRIANAGSILTGSFAVAGDQLEVGFKILDSKTGEIRLAERSRGSKEEVFRIVDELSNKVRRSYLADIVSQEQFEDLRNVTTSSLEAYRYYVEGLVLEMALKREEAIVLLEKAVEIDPEFAMAHGRLGWIYQNLGMAGKANESLKAAFVLSDRLPSRERYLVEALYFAQRWDTYAMAADSWRKALALDPTLNSTRHQLAMHYGKMEMFAEAIELWEALRDSSYSYAGIENGLGHMYSALGEHAKGQQILEEMLATNPDRADAYLALGFNLVLGGKPDDALVRFQRALTLQSTAPPYVYVGMWRAHMAKRDYASASVVADTMLTNSHRFSQWGGMVNHAKLDELFGRSKSALDRYQQAINSFDTPNAFTAMARVMAARVLVSKGSTDAALEMALLAIKESDGEFPEWDARFLIARITHLQGDRERAGKMADEILTLATSQPGSILLRMHHHLLGQFSLADGDFNQAIRHLERANESLSAYGIQWHLLRQPDHAAIWFDLGMANLGAEKPDNASKWFRRIIESRLEWLEYPDIYSQSYYYLGKAAEMAGQQEEANTQFNKFLQYVSEGDLHTEKKAYALKHVRPLG